MVTAHSRYLTRTEAEDYDRGNTDERGSREYNITLGQKRADSVRQMMKIMGVKEDQIETVSFGEENRATKGTTRRHSRKPPRRYPLRGRQVNASGWKNRA
jgi:peptidoglycan-associated lipoprotein